MKMNVTANIFYLTSQGTPPTAVIPKVLEDVVPAIMESLDKEAKDGLEVYISTENLGKGLRFKTAV